jgi:hypothetical protein
MHTKSDGKSEEEMQQDTDFRSVKEHCELDESNMKRMTTMKRVASLARGILLSVGRVNGLCLPRDQKFRQ